MIVFTTEHGEGACIVRLDGTLDANDAPRESSTTWLTRQGADSYGLPVTTPEPGRLMG
jgi:hypothetical protein